MDHQIVPIVGVYAICIKLTYLISITPTLILYVQLFQFAKTVLSATTTASLRNQDDEYAALSGALFYTL